MKRRAVFMVVVFSSFVALWGSGYAPVAAASEMIPAEVPAERLGVRSPETAPPEPSVAKDGARQREQRQGQGARDERDPSRRQAGNERPSTPDLSGEVSEVGEDRIVVRLAKHDARGEDTRMPQRETRQSTMVFSGETTTVQWSEGTEVRIRVAGSDARRPDTAVPQDIKAGDRVLIWLGEDSENAERIIVRRGPAR